MDIPAILKQSLESGSCVLFIGAGMGHYMKDTAGDHIPDGNELSQKLVDKFSVPVGGALDLTKVSQYIEFKNKGRKELITFIRSCLSDITPDENILWIPSIHWKAIFTTNYDNAIERAYDLHDSPAQNYITITKSTGIKDFNPYTEVPIIHLHGALFDESSPEIIITQQDYIKFKNQRKMMFDYLKHQMAVSCVLYIGYSNNDTNWNLLISEIEEEYYPEPLPISFRVDPHTPPIDIELLRDKNISTIEQKFDEFVIDAKTQLNNNYPKLDNLNKLEDKIPSDFIESFRNNATSILRLISSWDYINQLPPEKLTTNVHSYLKGDKPNWGIIFNNLYFKRDIEDEIYETLMDYATDTKAHAKICLILGPAGYGVSTLLMSLAARMVKEHAGKVFFYKYPSELREGDVFHAMSLNTDQHFFFIDNAADHTQFIKNAMQHIRDSGKSVMFVLGDRINEWKQARSSLRGETFEIQPLSDSEIESLLDLLNNCSALGKMEALDRDHRIAAIRKNYQRELLVAIREATEGKNFDAIIQDEFFGIKNELSQRAYAYISCFNQHGAVLRADLLSHLLNITISELYTQIKDFLDGVIREECIDEIRGDFAFRTRHRLIAQIVWDRCVPIGQRDSIVHKAIDNLNILQPVDKEAFESFYKSDKFIDSLRTLESRILFFEKACKKDPDNPYVRQHYARMQIRSKMEGPALRIIEEAIAMDDKIRVLHHTKGYILSCMVLTAESQEISRRRLIQSEEAYFIALKMNDKDEYCYQGLAQLYLNWAKIVESDEERALYLNKSEDIINEGLKKARDKEALWIESSNIDDFIGDDESKIKSLETAVKEAPGSIISKYLLAKAYNINGKYDKGLPLLSELTKEYPDEYRPCIEYSLGLLKTGGSLPSAIAVLEQSTLYGLSDARYLATLGGLLFLNKDFTKAEKIFSESYRRELTNARTVLFDPPKHANVNTTYLGTVKYVGDGHSYFYIDGYPDIYCLSSKFNGIILRRGLKFMVSIVFTPIKPIARLLNPV